MNLEDLIRQTEELTEALRAAVADGDESACAPLLGRRGAVLGALETALRTAEPGERSAFAGRLRGLATADRDLRLAAETALARAGEACRAGFGLGGRGPAAGERPAPPPGLDRRA